MFPYGICPEYERLLCLAVIKAWIHSETVRELADSVGDHARFVQSHLRAHITLAEVRAVKEALQMHCREHMCAQDLRSVPRAEWSRGSQTAVALPLLANRCVNGQK